MKRPIPTLSLLLTASLLTASLLTGCLVEPPSDEAGDETVGEATDAARVCTLPSTRPLSVDSLARSGIDTADFISDVVADLDDDYMGYSAILIGTNGAEIATAKYGWARTRCEPEGERVFNHNTQTAWGSVTKVLTTALVIDKVERSSQTLDEAAWTNLPTAWRNDIVAANSPHMAVRIRDLLSHMSGFAGSNGVPLLERITGPLEKSLNTRIYSNANFTLFHHMGRFFRQSYFDDLEASFVPGEIPLDSYLETISISIYRNTLEDRIADPLGIAFSCNQPEHAGSNYSRYYTTSSAKSGYMLNNADSQGCATGGVVMSPRDMAKFLHALTRTSDIISHDNYENEMAITSIRRLGWDYALPVAGGRMYGKNGSRGFSGPSSIPGNGAGSSYSEIVTFPNGMSALITTNSAPPLGSPGLATILADAYNANVTP
ncbi:MAG: beta-lactamase family protein [Myxococcales bacterium]|nr:beta-lactamase family protein [Myxococcales bacterium]